MHKSIFSRFVWAFWRNDGRRDGQKTGSVLVSYSAETRVSVLPVPRYWISGPVLASEMVLLRLATDWLNRKALRYDYLNRCLIKIGVSSW